MLASCTLSVALTWIIVPSIVSYQLLSIGLKDIRLNTRLPHLPNSPPIFFFITMAVAHTFCLQTRILLCDGPYVMCRCVSALIYIPYLFSSLMLIRTGIGVRSVCVDVKTRRRIIVGCSSKLDSFVGQFPLSQKLIYH